MGSGVSGSYGLQHPLHRSGFAIGHEVKGTLALNGVETKGRLAKAGVAG